MEGRRRRGAMPTRTNRGEGRPRHQTSPRNRTQPLPRQDYIHRLDIDRERRQNRMRDRRDTLPKGETRHRTTQWKENKIIQDNVHGHFYVHFGKKLRKQTGDYTLKQ